MTKMTLKLLSWNIGIGTAAKQQIWPPERIRNLVSGEKPHIVFLQEHFLGADQSLFIEGEYVVIEKIIPQDRNNYNSRVSLLIAIRCEIFDQLRKPATESESGYRISYPGERSMLVELKKQIFVNIHLKSGNQESMQNRKRTIEAVLCELEKANKPAIIGGDWNQKQDTINKSKAQCWKQMGPYYPPCKKFDYFSYWPKIMPKESPFKSYTPFCIKKPDGSCGHVHQPIICELNL
jgi:exonuclease III